MSEELFAGAGEMAARLRSIDWSRTRLGPVSSWPTPLRTTAAIVLANKFPMLLWWGPDLVQIYNDGYRPILGEKHPLAAGAPGREVWSEIWHIIGPMADDVLAGRRSVLAEHLLLPMNRKGFVEDAYFTFSYSPVPDEHGGIGGVLVTVQETTEQVQASRQLRTLRALADVATASRSAEEVARSGVEVLATNPIDLPFALVYLAQGEGPPVLTGHTPLEEPARTMLLAREWPFEHATRAERELIVENLDVLSVPIEGVPRAPIRRALVAPLRRSTTTTPYGYLVMGLNPMRPLDERYTELLRLVTDQFVKAIASARAFEEERRRAEALAEIDRAKTIFFSNVSHEFRTPLALMLGPTEDALASTDRALRGEQLEIVHRNELRLLKLVNALLDFARAESGRARATVAPTHLAALTRDLASAFRSAIDRAGLGFEVDCPDLREPVLVDPDMWEKIVLNLLSNALKFTFEGTIRVSLRASDDHVELEVSDTGVGIAPDQLPRVFDRFHRIEGVRSRTHEGSGIGLALARDLVELHGGDIRVTSELGRGTTFTVAVPWRSASVPLGEGPRTTPGLARAYVAEALRWLPDEPAPLSTPSVDLERSRILVVDDNADMREYLARLLREHWSVTTAEDGVDALEKLGSQPFALVLSDVMMPRLDGFGLVRAIRSDPAKKQTPVVLVSARAGEESVADGLRSGADDYVVKPFSAATLVMRVEAQLAAARAREDARRQSEGERERLKAMFEVSPSALAMLRGRELRVDFVNPKMREVWGGRDVVGKPLLDVVPELRGQGFDAQLHRTFDTGVPYHGKEVLARLPRPGSTELVDLYFDFVYVALRDPDGSIGGVLVHAFDVTELVKERRAAEAANRMKDEFLATMSHELRTPLTSILGWASMLLTRDHDEAARRGALLTIERNAKAQARLIEDILDVSRIVSGKLRLSLERIELSKVVTAAVEVIRPAADAKGVSLTTALPTEHVSVLGDADRLQQVVWNLLSNAVRFTPSGGNIDVEVLQHQGAVEIVVRDTGIGIAPEHLPHVFERFRQADSSTTRSHGGLGLGLAIVRHLVELHGGSVLAESDGPSTGATFTLLLPTRATSTSALAPELPPANDDDERDVRVELRGMRIMVVDDDDDSRELVAAALESAGAEVVKADSARTAYELVQRVKPDLLISDIGMPNEDGYSLMRRVRLLPEREGGGVPAIALTAYARSEDARAALEAGYQQHVGKPVAPEPLRAAAVEVVRTARERIARAG